MKEIFDLINSMAPYLLLGFLLAGLMHAFVPQNLYRRYLGGNSFRSVLNAALLGIPLPLCSCGVIPTAMSLRKEGASKGATVSFLISTPQTGVDSIIATYSLIGLPFALLRPLAALVTSLFGGCLVNRFDDKDVCSTSCAAPSESVDGGVRVSFRQRLQSAFRYAFVEMMQDIGKWLLLGLVVAGLITVFVPDSFFALFADKPLLSMLLVLAFAVPMYLCATGSIPIAVALMLKGLSPGTALVLLMAGPAVNVASMLVISKVMGKKTLLFYLLSIVSGAIAFGLAIDYLLPREWFLTSLAHIHDCHAQGVSWFNLGCTLLMLLLLVNAFVLRYRKQDSCELPSDKNWVMMVKGMTCNHCKNNVEKAIMKVDGVEQVDINLADGRTVVTGSFDREAIKKSVEGIGFEVVEGD
ncbi:MAG: SO_0444 family Cu/Zn efflux transporter [Bacteroidaceae bacterium]|nr:SO_0444 family Cu/Zn efflux transporter [Bacteroidaceae bacterium]